MDEKTEVKKKRHFCAFEIRMTDGFRFDCDKIRKDLIQQKDEEKQKAIDELHKQRQNNITSAQSQINELEQQVRERNLFRSIFY